MLKLSLFSCIGSIIILLSCADTKSTGVFDKKNIYNFAGLYKGIIPCTDCLGIEATLTIHLDSTFNAVFYHINGNRRSETLKGNISFIETDIFQLQVTGNNLIYNYKIISDSSLLALDNNFNLIEENNVDAYQLKTIESLKPEEIIGEYISQDTVHLQNHILDIQHVEDNEYSVMIISPEGKRGCDFDGFATLMNNQLNIRLKTVKRKLNATIVVKFQSDTAEVFAAEKEDHPDLEEFCDDGKSLEGIYVKHSDSTSQEME